MAADPHKSKAGVTWLNAWHDPVANLPITSARMCLADVTGAGEVDLLAVDNANRIRVYRGTNLVSETLLLGAPSAIAPVYQHPPLTLTLKSRINAVRSPGTWTRGIQ